MSKLLELKNLSVAFKNKQGQRAFAVDNISFGINKSEILCLVGESGCGKSISARAILRLEPEGAEITQGQAFFKGQDLQTLSQKNLLKIRGNSISMIFQDPMASLNPVMKIGRQMAEGLRLHKKFSAEEAKKVCIKLLERVGISDPEERINSYPHELSGGMRQRVIIAQALSCKPQLIIADEPTTALDVTVQRQILLLLYELVKEAQSGLLLITHDLAVVAACADTVAVMYAGKIVEKGSAAEVLSKPCHPYTKGLLQSRLGLLDNVHNDGVDKKNRRLQAILGTVPSIWSKVDGCKFNPRCPRAEDICRKKEPPLQNSEKNKSSYSCFFRTESLQ